MDKNFKKNILKGSAATSIGTVSGMIFQFITVMIMTRYVPKDDFGIYVLVMVIVNMFNLLGGFGLELTMVKFIASVNKHERDNVLLPVLILRGIGSILFSLIFIFTARYILHIFDDRINNFILYITIIFVLADFRDLFYNLMQGLNQFKQYSIVNVSSSVFRVIVIFIYIYYGKLDIESLLIIEILSTLQPLVHQILVIPFKEYLTNKPTIKTFMKVIKFSIPLYLNNLVVFVNGRANVFIIGASLNPASVASYDVASKIPMALKKIFQSFIIVYFPNLAKLFSQGDKNTAVDLMKKSLGIFSAVMIIGVVLSYIFKEEITLILYSKRYIESAMTFALLILNFHLRGVSDLLGYSFVPAGAPTVPAKVNFIASIISIGSSFIFIPIFGFIGAAYALLLMNTASIIMFYYYAIKIGIPPGLKEIFQPILVALVGVGIYFVIGSEQLIIKILFAIIFITLNWFFIKEFKEISKSILSNLSKFNFRKKTVS